MNWLCCNRLTASRAICSLIIFISFLAASCYLVPERDHVDFLVRKMSPDYWCPRFEHFLCSNSQPDILVLSSSVGFVPSLVTDIKNADVNRPANLIDFDEMSVQYDAPAFLLAAIRAHGIDHISAAHMGIPTANISDDLLLLQQAFAYGKKPKVVVLAVNIRDFLVPPNWPAFEKFDEPIKRALGDIADPPKRISSIRSLRELFIYGRPGMIVRNLDEARFYLAYELYTLTKRVWFLHKLFRSSDILRNRMMSEIEVDNHYDAKVASLVNMVELDPKIQNDIFALRNLPFENRQFSAFKQFTALTKAHDARLVVMLVPLYPGMHAPESVVRQFGRTMGEVSKNGAFVLNVNDNRQFSEGQFIDVLHMNGLGGETMFWRLADFIAKHKDELLKRRP